MQEKKNLQQIWKKIPFAILGILSILVVMLLLLWSNIRTSQQSVPALYPDIYFSGEYRLADGPWNAVKAGQHIPATRADVTLRGQFHMLTPDGEYIGVAQEGMLIAFYLDHLQLTVTEEGHEPHIMDIEHPRAGEGMCGELSIGYQLLTEKPITLTFHNPHTFGNEKAIDNFLEELSFYSGLPYEKEFLNCGAPERNAGIGLVVVAFVLLGTALFSALLHMDRSANLTLIGMSILFAGCYFIYGSKGVFFWSDSIIGNTTVLGISVILYGQTVYIHDIDRAEDIMVVLQKKVGDTYNDIDSVAVKLTYEKNDEGLYTVGIGEYEFTDLPNDGTEYRVYLLVRNYAGTYDNSLS